jgi:hypothetical protein
MERPTAPWLTSPRSRQSWVPQPAFRRETSYCKRLSARRVRSIGWALVIRALGMKVAVLPTVMRAAADKRKLAKSLLAL